MAEILDRLPELVSAEDAVYAVVTAAVGDMLKGDFLICRRVALGAAPESGRRYLVKENGHVWIVTGGRRGGELVAEVVAMVRPLV